MYYDIVWSSKYHEYFLEHEGVIGFIKGQMLRLIFEKTGETVKTIFRPTQYCGVLNSTKFNS